MLLSLNADTLTLHFRIKALLGKAKNLSRVNASAKPFQRIQAIIKKCIILYALNNHVFVYNINLLLLTKGYEKCCYHATITIILSLDSSRKDFHSTRITLHLHVFNHNDFLVLTFCVDVYTSTC